MKAFQLIFLGLSFFFIHCGPLEEEERPSQLDDILWNLNSDISDDLNTEVETQDDEDVEAEDQVADITEELEDSEPQFIRNDEGFYADDFEHQEFYACVKEIGKNYSYELYEEPDDSPYACYLIHRYKNCGKSYSTEKGYCYHNAVKQKGYCRAQLEKNLAKRRSQGYICAPIEKPVQEEDSAGGDDQQGAADSEQQLTAAAETGSADEGAQPATVVKEEAATEGTTEAVDESGDDSGNEGTATVDDPDEEAKSDEGTTVPEDAEADSDEELEETSDDAGEEEDDDDSTSGNTTSGHLKTLKIQPRLV